jgi:hypothetical protein
MIDWKDFPFVTPEDNRREAFRISLSFRSEAALQEEARAQSARMERLMQKYIIARKNLEPESMRLDELLERFEEICLVQNEAQLQGDDQGIEHYNLCYRALEPVDEELKRRGLEARRALCRLYNHPVHHVRLQAALFSYGAAPLEARRCLEEIRRANLPHVSLAAGMTLSSIDAGTSMLD